MLIGTEYPDDAAVYRLNENTALIQTLDFFPPIVDDPFQYGQIAAANALSDVYAMGGEPITAMNIVCFPCKSLGTDILTEILRGGAEKVAEAEAMLVGGHTINDEEPKYGLAVAGLISPQNILTKGGAQPTNRLILTKPLGAGIITTALKGELVPADVLEDMINWMSFLNKSAAEVASKFKVTACTDITGFGLLGHTLEMLRESNCGVLFYLDSVPMVKGTLELAQTGLVPGGAHVNREYVLEHLAYNVDINEAMIDILCDPQTSGGLLMAVEKDEAKQVLELLHRSGLYMAAEIGEITSEERGKIVLK